LDTEERTRKWVWVGQRVLVVEREAAVSVFQIYYVE
jgi:hypothetical protein